jgi:hypothetical protein
MSVRLVIAQGGWRMRRVLSALLVLAGVGIAGAVAAQTQQIPQIGALLPSVVEVPPGEPLVIDGQWKISSIDKMIRIDRGRAYAIDGWVHLFVLKIQPGMVVLRHLKETEEGTFTGEDLPLAGQLTATLTGDRILDVKVAGKLGPARYQLVPQQLDEPEAFDALVKRIRKAESGKTNGE